MQLTRAQKRQIEQAKAAGEKRLTLRFTAGQKERWQATVETERAGKAENIAHLR